jgi:hypothetical protein
LQIFQAAVVLDFSSGNGFIDEKNFAVPAGSRLVIEWISASQFVPQGAGGGFGITTTGAGVQAFHALETSSSPTTDGNVTIATSRRVRIYADPGTFVTVSGTRSINKGSQFAGFVVTGYLESP